MHHLLGLLFDRMPPFSWLKVPSHGHNPWACLYEVALVLLMLAAIRWLTKSGSSAKKTSANAA